MEQHCRGDFVELRNYSPGGGQKPAALEAGFDGRHWECIHPSMHRTGHAGQERAPIAAGPACPDFRDHHTGSMCLQ